jgi:hypothetical protein
MDQGKPVKCKFDGLVTPELFNKANRGKVIITEQNGEVEIYTRPPQGKYAIKKGVRNPDFLTRSTLCAHTARSRCLVAPRGAD